MKLRFLPLILMGGLMTWVLPVTHAETDDAAPATKVSKKVKKTKKGKKKAEKSDDAMADSEESVVAAKLKGNTYFTESEPNLNAEYFIFLESASWCGPCNKEMPDVAKAYELMKASGKVELILLSADSTEKDALGFLQKHKATFPGLMPKGASVPERPQAKGIPNATIMKADGTIIESGHGSIIRNWKAQTIGRHAVIGDDGEPRVGEALKSIKFAGVKPNRKAKFYIYLYCPTEDNIDTNLMENLAAQYKEMKKDKVEVVFISGAKTPQELSKMLKAKKIKFPAVQKDAAGASELPGLGKLGSLPQTWIVTQSGAFVTSGPTDIAQEWKEVVDAN